MRRGLAFGVIFFSYAYFYQAGGWNQNARFALTRNLVTRGRLDIDRFVSTTGDTSRVGEHIASNKAPGQSLLAVPLVAPGSLIDSWTDGVVVVLTYVATLFTSGLFGALAALAIMWVARDLGATAGGGAFAALTFALGTPAWSYATLFTGHAVAAGCLMLAFAAAVALRHAGARRRDAWLAATVGLAAGWAVVTEYPAAPPAALVAGLAVLHARGRRGRVAAIVAAGALACAALLAAYHRAALGSVLTTPLANLDHFPEVQKQPFVWPSLAVAGELLGGARRGLLPIAPALAAAPLGLWLLWRQPAARAAALCSALIFAYYLLMNASFATPLAGWSYGPRYLAASLPFLAWPLAMVWTRASAFQRAALAALAAMGIVMTLIAVSTTAQPPDVIEQPIRELLWPAFRDGDLSLNHASFTDGTAFPSMLLGRQLRHVAFNLGELLGLSGHTSLAPLAAGWAGAAILWLRRRRMVEAA